VCEELSVESPQVTIRKLELELAIKAAENTRLQTLLELKRMGADVSTDMNIGESTSS
jgi:hypothetical protein